MVKAARALLVMVFGALLLSGCGVQNPTTAASVNSVVITDAQVQSVAAGLAAASEGATAGDNRLGSASLLISNEVARQVGVASGIAVTPEERKTLLDANESLSAMVAMPALTQLVNDYVDAYVIKTTLGDTAFATASAAVEVVVNPRFGTWNAAEGTLNGDSGSLSSPVPSAVPAG